MPNTKSAEKALRQSKRRQARNLSKKNAYKNAMKEFKKLFAAGKMKEAEELIRKVYQKVDKAAKSGVIKKNKANRLKSRATRLLKSK
ncbi:MAG: 30S ribosomal protein S20 [Patescibacteria group bacterium]